MSNFFPKYIALPAKSPTAILLEARTQWQNSSEGLLTLESREDEDMFEVLIVSNDRERREESIFWIEAATGFPYPCSIACESEERLVCTTQGEFRTALETAMNWSHVRSGLMNMLIWIDEAKS